MYCRVCGLLLAPDMVFNLNHQDSFDYQNHIAALHTLRNTNYDNVLREIKKYLPERSRGLEVGCGYGWFLARVKEYGFLCQGIEPEKQMYEIARSQGLDVINGFFPQDLPGELYDFIIFNDVFEHLPDIKASMEGVNRALKDDGILILNLPVSSGPYYRLAEWANAVGNQQLLRRMWQCDFYSPHYFYFNELSMKYMLNGYGFKLLEQRKLKTMNAGSVKARLDMGTISGASYLISMLATPVLLFLNGDIKCFIARKTNALVG